MIALLAAWIAFAAAFVMYASSPGLRVYASYPWPVYVLLLASVALAVASKPRGWLRGATLGVTSVVAALFTFYTVMYSDIGGGRLTVEAGDRFPAFTLETSTGEHFSPSEIAGKSAALYVFYRGDW